MTPARERTALPTLLLCQAVLIAGLTLSFPFMTIYLHHERGLPMGAVGLAIGVTMLATAAGQAVGGELSDRWGSKRVMALSLAGRGLFTALLASAVRDRWEVPALAGLLLGGSFLGNFYDPAVRAWIALEHPVRDRVRAYGLLRVAANGAFAVGPAIGGLMADVSYALMFGVTAAMCALCLLLLILAVPASPAVAEDRARDWRSFAALADDRRFMRLCALTLLLACAMAQIVSPLSVHATTHAGLKESQVGLLFTVNGVMVVLFQAWAAGAVSGRRLSASIAAGALFYAAAWSWIGFARGWTGLAIGVAIATVGEIIVSPCLTALAANLAPEALRGRYLGAQGLCAQLGHAAGPFLGGLGLEHLSGRWTPAPWLAAGALAGAASWGFLRIGRTLTPAHEGLEGETP